MALAAAHLEAIRIGPRAADRAVPGGELYLFLSDCGVPLHSEAMDVEASGDVFDIGNPEVDGTGDWF